jgi:hypothetical protein
MPRDSVKFSQVSSPSLKPALAATAFKLQTFCFFLLPMRHIPGAHPLQHSSI